MRPVGIKEDSQPKLRRKSNTEQSIRHCQGSGQAKRYAIWASDGFARCQIRFQGRQDCRKRHERRSWKWKDGCPLQSKRHLQSRGCSHRYREPSWPFGQKQPPPRGRCQAWATGERTCSRSYDGSPGTSCHTLKREWETYSLLGTRDKGKSKTLGNSRKRCEQCCRDHWQPCGKAKGWLWIHPWTASRKDDGESIKIFHLPRLGQAAKHRDQGNSSGKRHLAKRSRCHSPCWSILGSEQRGSWHEKGQNHHSLEERRHWRCEVL